MSNMFYWSALTSINLDSFDTGQVTNMEAMFYNCTNLTNIDLHNFNTNQVINMQYMFSMCSNLTEIKISSLWNVSNVTSSNDMFYSCSSLQNYNSSNVDVSMAKPTTQGGYLTLV